MFDVIVGSGRILCWPAGPEVSRTTYGGGGAVAALCQDAVLQYRCLCCLVAPTHHPRNPPPCVLDLVRHLCSSGCLADVVTTHCTERAWKCGNTGVDEICDETTTSLKPVVVRHEF